jgi:hypothetical protein
VLTFFAFRAHIDTAAEIAASDTMKQSTRKASLGSSYKKNKSPTLVGLQASESKRENNLWIRRQKLLVNTWKPKINLWGGWLLLRQKKCSEWSKNLKRLLGWPTWRIILPIFTIRLSLGAVWSFTRGYSLCSDSTRGVQLLTVVQLNNNTCGKKSNESSSYRSNTSNTTSI